MPAKCGRPNLPPARRSPTRLAHTRHLPAKRTPDDTLAILWDDAAIPSAVDGAVYHMRNGTWGALCSDGFGPRAAAVACRQLGYSGTATASYTTQWTQLAWIANVSCEGTETRLVDCPHEEVTLRSCPNGYATLTCTPNPGAYGTSC